MTNPSRLPALLFAAALAMGPLGASAAFAQNASPTIVAGQKVVDPEGRPLGSVERIIRDPSGKPSQVVLRTVAVRGGSPSALKILPISAFVESDKPSTPPILVAPLVREEIDLLPNAQ